MAPRLHPDRPFRPASAPFFYGWVVVAVGTLGILMSIPGQTMGVSVFTEPLMAATGMSRLELSNAYLVGTLASGLALPLGGTLLDRIGARVMGIAACLGLATTLLFLSIADAFARGVADALAAPASWAAAVVLSVAFAALRFSGQGMLTLVSRTMVAKWFERRRGLVSGITGVFISFGFSLAPVLLLFWIDAAGWRGAWQGMAAAVGLGMGAVVLLFYRDNPEECGLRMDGAPFAPDTGSDRAVAVVEEPGYTRQQALGTFGFWSLSFPLVVQAMVFTGVTFHIVDVGAESGVDRAAAVAIFVPVAVVSTATGFLVGAAADRVRLQWIVALMSLLQAVGFLGVARMGEPLYYAAAVAGWGVSGGCYGPLLSVGVARWFGRTHIGAIGGVQTSAMVIGSALGPAALALSERYLAGYGPGLRSCAVLSLAGVVIAAVTRTPPRRPRTGELG